MAERVGFEPTAHCCVTGFQDQLLKPLGHLSRYLPETDAIIPEQIKNVNDFLSRNWKRGCRILQHPLQNKQETDGFPAYFVACGRVIERERGLQGSAACGGTSDRSS